MGSSSSARIIKNVDIAVKAVEIVYPVNGAVVEGVANINGHSHKVVGEG